MIYKMAMMSNSIFMKDTKGNVSGSKFSYSVQTKDTNGNLSSPHHVKVQVPLDCAVNSGGAGSGQCFIATATYGSPIESEVKFLRNFRDQFLLTHSIGKKFVELYYIVSPPIAAIIQDSDFLKVVVKIILFPVILIAKILLQVETLLSLLYLVLYFNSVGFVFSQIYLASKKIDNLLPKSVNFGILKNA